VSFLQFLRALRARFKVFVVAVSTVVLGTLIASVLMPKAYRATVALLVDTSDQQSLGEAARPLMLPQERLSYLQTQVDILTSRTVARKVVRDLNLLQSPAALAALGVKVSGAGPLEERLVEQLLKQLKAETSQSSVIQARFSCADPLLSATIANGFAKAYIDTVLELRVAPTREAAAWFDEQLKSLRANLEEAQARLAAYQQQAVSRYVAHGGSPDSLPEVANNTVIQQLKADVLRGDAKLKELATRYGVNHPQYQRVASENGALRARLDAAIRKVLAGIVAAARQGQPRDTEPRSGLYLQRSELGARTAGADRAALNDPALSRNEFTVLKLNVESAERAYDTAMQRHVVSQIDSRASATNVAVLSPAAAPWAPYQPKIVLNVALSIVTGTLLGAVLVALLEAWDRRVRSGEDLLLASERPLLAVLGGEGRPATLLLSGPSFRQVPALPKLR
jgi:uncharacterized protein involved in exopolysaccharide biosynthesis